MSSVREREPRFPHVAIRASAGSGKTYRLATRFVELVLAGEHPDRILATTFTRKAAGEILERVLLRLARAATDATHCAALADEVLDATVDTGRVRSALVSVVRSMHRLRVCTLDSFFGGLAGSFALDMGLPPTWSIIEDHDDDRLRLDALDAMLRDQPVSRTLELMRMFGRGTASQGVASRLADLVGDLHDLYLEAPGDAWVVPDRRSQLRAEELSTVLERIETLPVAKAIAKGRTADLEKARAGDWEKLLSAGLIPKILSGESYHRIAVPVDLARAYAPLIDHAADVLLDRLQQQTVATRDLLAAFDVHYRRLQARGRVLRFGDITRVLADRARVVPLDEVYFRLDARIAHLLLDEFQDTSGIQWQVLRPFAEEVVAHGDDQRSFLCVGDVKQAIYGWRGGEAEIFEALDSQLGHLRWIPLDQSRRSAPAVIDVVNTVFGSLETNPALESHRRGAREWSRGFSQHTTVHTERPGHVRLVVGPEPVEGQKASAAVLVYAAEHVAEVLRQWPSRGVGVLVRRNASVARLIFELRQRGIHASQEGGNPLTDSPAVNAVLSALTLADHPGDSVAKFHLDHTPLGPLVGATVDASTRDVSFALRRTLAERGFGASIASWVALLEPACDARERARLRQLVELAHDADPAPCSRPSDFVRFVLGRKVDDPSSARVRVMTVHQAKGLQFDTVVLPELDGAIVRASGSGVLVGRNGPADRIARVIRGVGREIDALAPTIAGMRADHEAHLARESLSVLYVALTRAVHGLHMIVAPATDGAAGTHAGIVCSALAPGSTLGAGAVLYEHGVDPPATGVEVVAMEPSAGVEPTRQAVSVRSAPRARHLPRMRPSEPLRGVVALRDLLRVDTSKARERGALLHAWLEHVEWIERGLPSSELLDVIAARFALDRSEREVARAHWDAAMASPGIREALSEVEWKKSRAPDAQGFRVERELPFAWRDGGALWTGAFDRLVVAERDGTPLQAWVLDFKSDVDVHLERHVSQMRAYRRAAAWHLDLQVDRVQGLVVDLRKGAVSSVAMGA